MSKLTKLVREPLLHFLGLGALVFALFAMIGVPEDSESKPQWSVVISQSQIDGMAARFESTWKRPPDDLELKGLIDAHVRQDILVQEALALSMDENDPVIRQRLAQKMDFLVESAASAAPPTEAELHDFFADNANSYASAPLLTFEQIFLGEAPTEAFFSTTIDAAQSGVNPSELGIDTLLPGVVRSADRRMIAQTLGADLFGDIASLEQDEWDGPFRSGFGLHIVRVMDYQAPVIPDLEDVRAKVEADWLGQKSEELSAELFDEMRSHYTITLPAAFSQDITQQ